MAYKQEIKCEIVEHLTVLDERNSGWNLELNIVKWNGGDAKYDIRPWNAEHDKCGKGIALSEEELKKLVAYCNENRLHEI